MLPVKTDFKLFRLYDFEATGILLLVFGKAFLHSLIFKFRIPTFVYTRLSKRLFIHLIISLVQMLNLLDYRVIFRSLSILIAILGFLPLFIVVR